MTPLMRKLLIWRQQENKGEKKTEVADGAAHKDTQVWQQGDNLKRIHSSGEGPSKNQSQASLSSSLTESYKEEYYR